MPLVLRGGLNLFVNEINVFNTVCLCCLDVLAQAEGQRPAIHRDLAANGVRDTCLI